MTKREEFENTKEFEKVKEKLMNEEELIKEMLRKNKINIEFDNKGLKSFIDFYIEKGKLEERERIIKIIREDITCKSKYCEICNYYKALIKQLSKEIGGIGE